MARRRSRRAAAASRAAVPDRLPPSRAWRVPHVLHRPRAPPRAACGEIFDVLVELRDVPGPLELGIGELFIQTEAHVLAQRHREEECFLWDVADRATELLERAALHADAVDEDLTLLRVEEPRNEVDHRRFP